jgi:hypothetical protein
MLCLLARQYEDFQGVARGGQVSSVVAQRGPNLAHCQSLNC